jgi:ATP-dependent helicase/nuclease subunit A
LPSGDGPGIAPSRAGSSAERTKALARGTLIHRLLQALPAIAPERRADAALRYLDGAAPAFSEAERAQMAAQATSLLADARFAALFGEGSRAEVPIVGRLAVRGQIVSVSGQVDRLAVTAGSVLIADYKTNRFNTNRPPPRRPEDVPESYVRQLALYRGVLTRLYPDRGVRAALVFTDVPDLMEILPEALDRALTSL